MFGPNEVDIQFPTFIPVHLTYQTAFVDDSGKLQFRDDIYGRDRQVLALLKGDERKVADIPIERKENVVRRQALALPDSVFSDNRGQRMAAAVAPMAAAATTSSPACSALRRLLRRRRLRASRSASRSTRPKSVKAERSICRAGFTLEAQQVRPVASLAGSHQAAASLRDFLTSPRVLRLPRPYFATLCR